MSFIKVVYKKLLNINLSYLKSMHLLQKKTQSVGLNYNSIDWFLHKRKIDLKSVKHSQAKIVSTQAVSHIMEGNTNQIC